MGEARRETFMGTAFYRGKAEVIGPIDPNDYVSWDDLAEVLANVAEAYGQDIEALCDEVERLKEKAGEPW